jgi:hypothetical protein
LRALHYQPPFSGIIFFHEKQTEFSVFDLCPQEWAEAVGRPILAEALSSLLDAGLDAGVSRKATDEADAVCQCISAAE